MIITKLFAFLCIGRKTYIFSYEDDPELLGSGFLIVYYILIITKG